MFMNRVQWRLGDPLDECASTLYYRIEGAVYSVERLRSWLGSLMINKDRSKAWLVDSTNLDKMVHPKLYFGGPNCALEWQWLRLFDSNTPVGRFAAWCQHTREVALHDSYLIDYHDCEYGMLAGEVWRERYVSPPEQRADV